MENPEKDKKEELNNNGPSEDVTEQKEEQKEKISSKQENPAENDTLLEAADSEELTSQNTETDEADEKVEGNETESSTLGIDDFKIKTSAIDLNKLFLVCSEDVSMKDKVSNFLQELKINPIYTHQKQGSSKPIAQIHNENKGINFAIVLLHADDFSYSREKGSPNSAVMKSNQKVVFELGYWIAKLGRDKVVALYYDQKSYRCPTEFFDALYIPFDKKNLWQNELKEKFKNWGFNI